MTTESSNQAQGEETVKKGSLKRDLGLTTLVALGVGSIIGSGMFAMPAVMGSVAGPALIIAIVLTGIVTTLLAISYAELGSAFPLSGGPYSLPRLALGDTGGFLMGWGYFLYSFIGTAAIIDIFVTYLAFWVPGLAVGETLTPLGIAIAVIALWIFTAINVVGGKIIPLIVFAAVGLSFFSGVNFVPLLPFGLTGVTLAMAFEFWAFTGFESVVVPTEEVKDPEKNIPRAMLLTMGIVIAVYVLIAVAFVGMINWSGLGIAVGDWGSIGNLTSPLSDVAQAAGLPILAIVATVGALISTAGSGGDWVLLQGRIPYAMAKDGLFWGPMDSVHHKWGTPHVALIFAAVLTMIIQIFIPNFPSVALIASITALVPYAAAVLSVPILRKTKPDVKRPFKLPVPLFITGLGFILATLLIYWASWPWTLVGAVLMLIGYPLYLTFRGKKFEFTRNLWILVYLVFIIVMSFIGDTNFIYENFLPIGPLGLIPMPYDMVVVTAFAILIFAWAYKVNTKEITN